MKGEGTVSKSLLYIHNSALDSEKANLIQVICMCNSFSDNGYKVKLLLPKSRLEKSKDFIKEKFGYDIDFEILFYEKTYKNEKLEKYFGHDKIYKFLNQDKSQYVFTRIPN